MSLTRMISWNVNGIRAVIKKNFADFVLEEQPDILCLQETKTAGVPIDLTHLNLPSYHLYWNHALKAGYSGTAILTKKEPLSVSYGIGQEKHDKEGRVITAEFPSFYLVNVYVPNSKQKLERLPYRYQEWDPDFLAHCKNLEKKKPVIFCGDLNVAHKEIDLTYPKANMKNHGFTPEERKGFDNIVEAGFVDAFRVFNQEGGRYSWWSPFRDARSRNIGWRIDYFCVSSSLRAKLKNAFILDKVMGSDHCPVGIEIEI